MFIGVGESVLTPTSMSMLADRFPPARLGFAAGVYYMGVPIGVGASLVIAGTLGPSIGWRNCFYGGLLGALGIALAVVMLFVKETPRRQSAGETGGRPKLKEIFSTAAQALPCPALALTMAGVSPCTLFSARRLDQLWYVQERGFERAYIAETTGWIAVAAGVLGNLFGGMGGDWWQKRTGQGRATFPVLDSPRVGALQRALSHRGSGHDLVLARGLRRVLPARSVLRTHLRLCPGAGAATDSRHRSSLLHPNVELVGLGFGITAGGICIDWMLEAGVDQPYTWTLVVFTVISLLAMPLFFLAGRRFTADRDRLFALHRRRGLEPALFA